MVNVKLPKLKKLKDKESESDGPKMEYKYDPRPCIKLNSEDIPQISSWKVGEEYTLVMKVRMEEMSSREDMNSGGKSKTNGEFRVVSIGVSE